MPTKSISWLFWLNILYNLVVYGYLGDEYTFYYESHRYHIHNANQSNIDNKNINILLNENISIRIVLNNESDHFLYINNQPLISDYTNDNEYNEIQTFQSSIRRRLEYATDAPPSHDSYWSRRYKRKGRFIAFFPGYRRYNYKECSHYCRRKYGGLASIVSDIEQKDITVICKDILEHPAAPDKYKGCDEQLKGTKDVDYRGCQDKTINGNECQKWTSQTPHGHSRTPWNPTYANKGLGDHNYCRNPDGEPSIWCYTTNPSVRWELCKPRQPQTSAGQSEVTFRGTSCYIGLQRPFTQWDDQRKVDKYKNWSPGQPDNAGNKENCGEIWPFNNGVWNDVQCNGLKSCICEDPRGVFYGKYIAVQAERTYDRAERYCQDHYGTTLATISTNEENEQVLKACQKIIIKSSIGSCWIGLKRPFSQWNDGTWADEKYTNWYPGEPNNKNEKCAELYTAHSGKWNDLKCHYPRFFVCNALSKTQRMPYYKRETMIAKRMKRHQLRWERYQDRAHRKAMSKLLWQQMEQSRNQMAMNMGSSHHKRMEDLRRHIFQQLYPGVPYSSVGHNNKFIMSAKMFGGSRLGKQGGYRRLLLKRRQNHRYGRGNSEQDRIHKHKRETDMTGIVEAVDENIYERKCIMVGVMNEMYELCVGESYIDIKRFIRKDKNVKDSERLIGDESANIYNDSVVSDGMGYIDFEDWKYKQILLMEHRMGESEVGIVKYMVDDSFMKYVYVYEKVYDYDSKDRMQCLSVVEWYDICMELEDDNMIVFRDPFVKFEFNKDEYWDDVIKHYDGNENGISIEKCAKFDETKLCVLKTVNDIYKLMVVGYI